MVQKSGGDGTTVPGFVLVVGDCIVPFLSIFVRDVVLEHFEEIENRCLGVPKLRQGGSLCHSLEMVIEIFGAVPITTTSLRLTLLGRMKMVSFISPRSRVRFTPLWDSVTLLYCDVMAYLPLL